MRFSVLTFGCRVNQAESLAIEAALRSSGACPVEVGDADLVVVNSCTVTASADQGTRQAIRKVARENPSATIVVTGCYATRNPAEVAALPGVVRVVANSEKDALPGRIADLCAETSGRVATGGDSAEAPRHSRHLTTAERYAGASGPCGAADDALLLSPGAAGRTAFTLRVQTGCEEQCAYCIIPSTRGRSRSTPVADLVREVRRVEAAGYHAVTLTGVHLGAYGRDLTPPATLVSLVGSLLGATEHLVFRLGSLEPMDCPPSLVDLMLASGRLAPALHLPLQHASDRMLSAMRRPYTRASYAAIVDDVRARLPHASITADVIVGFPGETDDDAAELLAYLEASPLTQLHVFPYSDRPGTEASAMQGKVHGALVRERAARVRAVGQRLAEAFRQSQHGLVRRALTIEDGRAATTDNGLRVEIGAGRRRNEHVRLRLEYDGARLIGTVVEGSESTGSRL